ncbi:sugar transporter [Myriangium duriaei CBS 260.36]|uniref:Sugar transporter n=1 Tax=Myriangium duriaei CBS 260.36 TaxID=1168546 RepID=A0A9P4J061_9PEZI|nr:sugar transporter [Myriangium duriaei CBS 260.36]
MEKPTQSEFVASHVERLSHDAETAIALEKSMGVMQAIRKYPKAVFFSMMLSLCVIMEGYDTALLGNFYGLPQFRLRFGSRLPDGDHQLTSGWQSGLQNGTQVGQIFGLMFAGILADRFGYRKTLLGALLLTICLIFLFFFAQNIGMLFAAEVLCGLPWGAFQTLTTTYAADVTPIPLRPILTTYVNMCWVIGQFLSTGILRGLLSRTDDWAWRIPYAIQWVFPPIIISGIIFAPESPTWLVRKGRLADARRALRALTAAGTPDVEIDQTVALLFHTDALEKVLTEGTSYWDCFRSTNWRRTEIACGVWVAQVACGIWFGGNVVYFLEQAGFATSKSFDFGVGQNAIALIGTILAWFVLPRIGRRTLFLVGLIVMFTILMAVGFMGIPSVQPELGWASGSLMMIFVLTYDLTVGPVCYCLVAEIPSTRLRIKTVVLARNAYLIASLVANFLNPPILNPSAWNLRGKGGFIWAGICFCMMLWTYFRLPETRGRSAAELDILFEQKTRTRAFSTTVADPFNTEVSYKAIELATVTGVEVD